MKCPDCKDGFYYPLVGPPEPCLACENSPTMSFLTYPLVSFSSASVDPSQRDAILLSIKSLGLIQPIKVRLEDGIAYVIDGKCRIAAIRKWCLEDTDSFLKRFPDYQIPIMEIK